MKLEVNAYAFGLRFWFDWIPNVCNNAVVYILPQSQTRKTASRFSPRDRARPLRDYLRFLDRLRIDVNFRHTSKINTTINTN
jgi:hypothetical protein